MPSLLNNQRPPVFCPGCSHEAVLQATDKAFQEMGLKGNQVAMISDIGCSGLFDTFFNTHALHGLHGRALTYAAGLKLAQPELEVVVTMGDGGLGIGGAHLLEACRRNLDLTLLILNNFNFGMTGGQFSATTPPGARVTSGFLNSLERPMDAASVVKAAGAPFVARVSAHQQDLFEIIREAIGFDGFAVVDIWGVCPGRYLKKNKLNPSLITEALEERPRAHGPVPENQRPEYGKSYRTQADGLKEGSLPVGLAKTCQPLTDSRQEVVIAGEAGQRIQTAGKILGLAGLSCGLQSTQKSEYNITVLRGPSISDIILSPQRIGFTGMVQPTVMIALSAEGVERRKQYFMEMDSDGLIIRVAGVELPESKARVLTVDFKALGIKKVDHALASLAVLAGAQRIISKEMLAKGLEYLFEGKAALLESVQTVLSKLDKGV